MPATVHGFFRGAFSLFSRMGFVILVVALIVKPALLAELVSGPEPSTTHVGSARSGDGGDTLPGG
jgi:hypothetical protein